MYSEKCDAWRRPPKFHLARSNSTLGWLPLAANPRCLITADLEFSCGELALENGGLH
jgi:hypothetical protein